MNDIQKLVFAHLTDPHGSGQRGQALHILTTSNFFTEATADDSVTQLHDFIEEYGPTGTNQFCADGIRRFCEAVGIDNPAQRQPQTGPQSDELYLSIDFRLIRPNGLPLNDADGGTNDAACVEIDTVVNKIIHVIQLIRDDTFTLEDVRLAEWWTRNGHRTAT